MIRTLVSKGRPWSRVTGPIAALYQTMREYKWNLTSPMCLIDSMGAKHDMMEFCPAEVAALVRD